jgi:DNA-binding XRE family transcriptional regulator
MKRARIAKELSQAELAHAVGVSRQTVNMIESGGMGHPRSPHQLQHHAAQR